MWLPEPRQKFRENKSLSLAPIVPPCGAVQSQALDSVVCPQHRRQHTWCYSDLSLLKVRSWVRHPSCVTFLSLSAFICKMGVTFLQKLL